MEVVKCMVRILRRTVVIDPRPAMSDPAVLIAGGGPTGLMLAGELALAGVDVAIVERRASQDLVGSRAGGLHARSIEVLDQRGIADRFLSRGKTTRSRRFAGSRWTSATFPTRHNYVLGAPGRTISSASWPTGSASSRCRSLAEERWWASRRTTTASTSSCRTAESLRAQYLVGCDGGRSLIRKTAGIDFPGWDPTTSWLIAEVEMADEPVWGFRGDSSGVHAHRQTGGRRHGRRRADRRPATNRARTDAQDLSAALVAIYGTDFRVHSPTWISRFTDLTRQAAAYRERRVLLAGDAAHVHSPVGGQGLNIGMQDAVNLGWKLAQVVKRVAPESLLRPTIPSATRWLPACSTTRWRRSLFAARTPVARL